MTAVRELHAYVQASGLDMLLSEPEAVLTVLASVNSAFNALDSAALEALLANETEIAEVCTQLLAASAK
jgi:uncharacterized surface protein with fasciclin (FAS1) repeats